MLIKYWQESCEEIKQDYSFPSIDAGVYGQIKKYKRQNCKTFTSKTINLGKDIAILMIAITQRNKKERAQQMINLQIRNNAEFDFLLDRLNEIATSIYNRLEHINSIGGLNIN